MAAVGLAVVVWAAVAWPADAGPAYHGWLPAFAVASGALVVGLRVSSPLRRVVSITPLVVLGRISYGMYLYHMILLHFVMIALARLNMSWPWLTFIVLTVTTIIVAELSYRFYETPFLRLKQRLSRSPKAEMAEGVAQPAN